MKLSFHGLFFVALLGSFSVQAQTKIAPKGRVQPKPRMGMGNPGAAVKDGLTLKAGRVVLTELGVTNPLTVDKKLVNGTTISTTGLVTSPSPSGTTVQMLEGDMVSLSGRVTSHTSIVEADSLLKIKQFDLKYPGKRKKTEEARLEKEKAKMKRDEEKLKAIKEKEKERAKRK